jgi:hypothetical protein
VTVARPDIIVELPERRLGRQCALQVGSGWTIPVLREALVKMTLGQRDLKIWDEFNLGLRSCRCTMPQWTWDAMGYEWARMSCQ